MTTYLAQANTGSDVLASLRSLSKPGGITAGAVGVFWLVRWSDTASFPAVSPPSGAVLRGTIATGHLQTLVYLHRVAAETSFGFSWTGARWSALSAAWFDGVDLALDLSTAPFESATGTGTGITTLTVTTVNAAALAWNVNTVDAASGVTHTPPTGFTEIADVPPWSTAYAISPGTGGQSASGATLSGSRVWAAGLVALAPPSGGVTGDTALSAASTLSATGARGATATSALAATVALSTVGHRTTAGTTTTASTAASLTAAGSRGASEEASLATAGALAATGQTAAVGDATLAAGATLTTSGQRGATTTADLGTTAALGVEGQAGRISDAALTSVATLVADGETDTPPTPGDAVLHLTAALTAAGVKASAGSVGLAATAILAASGTTSVTGDDIDVTVGAPYSPWTAGYPHPSAWTVQPPHASSWEVGAPC